MVFIRREEHNSRLITTHYNNNNNNSSGGTRRRTKPNASNSHSSSPTAHPSRNSSPTTTTMSEISTDSGKRKNIISPPIPNFVHVQNPKLCFTNITILVNYLSQFFEYMGKIH